MNLKQLLPLLELAPILMNAFSGLILVKFYFSTPKPFGVVKFSDIELPDPSFTPVVTLILYTTPFVILSLGSSKNVLLLFETDGDEDIRAQKPSSKKSELVSAFDN